MAKNWYIFLNDGETFSPVEGCHLVQLDEKLEELLDTGELKYVEDLELAGAKVLPINIGELE